MYDLISNIFMFGVVAGGFAFFLIFWLDFVPVYKIFRRSRKPIRK